PDSVACRSVASAAAVARAPRTAMLRTAEQRDELAPPHELPSDEDCNVAYHWTVKGAVHCSEIFPLMSVQGHLETKERCLDRVRFASISRNNSARLLRRIRGARPWKRDGIRAREKIINLRPHPLLRGTGQIMPSGLSEPFVEGSKDSAP